MNKIIEVILSGVMVAFIIEFMIVGYLIINKYETDEIDTGVDCVCCDKCMNKEVIK